MTTLTIMVDLYARHRSRIVEYREAQCNWMTILDLTARQPSLSTLSTCLQHMLRQESWSKLELRIWRDRMRSQGRSRELIQADKSSLKSQIRSVELKRCQAFHTSHRFRHGLSGNAEKKTIQDIQLNHFVSAPK